MTGNKNRKYFFRADNADTILVEKKFSESGLSSKSEFFRHMIIDGYVITADENLQKMIDGLLKNISNNINQIALVANRSGSIYSEDLKQIKKQLTEIWKEQTYLKSNIQRIKKTFEDEN